MKLTEILEEILKENNSPEADDPKSRVLNSLEFRSSRTLSGTGEDRLIKKISKDVAALEGEELKQYLKTNFLDRKNSWNARIIFSDLLKSFEGKKE